MKNKKVITVTAALFLGAIVLLSGTAEKQALADVGSVNGYTNDLGNDLGLFYVNVTPSSYYIVQGGTISFTGEHFYPAETVTIRSGGTTVGTITAGSDGRIATPSYMVSYTGGTHTYTVEGSESEIPYNVDVLVRSAQPWLTLSSYYAQGTESVTVNGYGFGYNETVSILYDGVEKGTATSDESGKVTFTVSPLVGAVLSTHDITMVGTKSNQSATAKLTIAL